MAVRSRQLAHPWAAALLCLALFSLLARAAGAGDGSTRGWPLSDWAGGRASSYGSLLEAQVGRSEAPGAAWWLATAWGGLAGSAGLRGCALGEPAQADTEGSSTLGPLRPAGQRRYAPETGRLQLRRERRRLALLAHRRPRAQQPPPQRPAAGRVRRLLRSPVRQRQRGPGELCRAGRLRAGRRCRAGGQWGVGHTAADPRMRLPADCMALTVPRLIERFAAIPAPLQGSPCAASGNASIVVAVVDACPGCADDQLALHPLAVSQLAPLSREAIPVRYRQVRGLGVGGAGAGVGCAQQVGPCQTAGFHSPWLSISKVRWRRCAPLHPKTTPVWPPLQVACRPPGNVIVTVEQYSVLRGGWMRLHVSQVWTVAHDAACCMTSHAAWIAALLWRAFAAGDIGFSCTVFSPDLFCAAAGGRQRRHPGRLAALHCSSCVPPRIRRRWGSHYPGEHAPGTARTAVLVHAGTVLGAACHAQD